MSIAVWTVEAGSGSGVGFERPRGSWVDRAFFQSVDEMSFSL